MNVITANSQKSLKIYIRFKRKFMNIYVTITEQEMRPRNSLEARALDAQVLFALIQCPWMALLSDLWKSLPCFSFNISKIYFSLLLCILFLTMHLNMYSIVLHIFKRYINCKHSSEVFFSLHPPRRLIKVTSSACGFFLFLSFFFEVGSLSYED